MKNIPKDIWLHIGENTPADADFDELLWGEVSWNNVKLENNAIHYVNADLFLDKVKRIVSFAEYSEDNSNDMTSIFVQLNELKEILTERR